MSDFVKHILSENQTEECEAVFNNICDQLGIESNLSVEELEDTWNVFVINKKEIMDEVSKCKNTTSFIDSDKYMDLLDPKDLIIDEDDYCYDKNELKQLYESKKNSGDPFKRPYDNKHFSDIKPKWLGGDDIKYYTVNNVEDISDRYMRKYFKNL